MNLPDVVSREEWVVARKKFLAEEKEFTKQRDRLNADRRRLPMVRVARSGYDVRRDLPCAVREDRGVPGADGVDVPVVLVVRE